MAVTYGGGVCYLLSTDTKPTTWPDSATIPTAALCYEMDTGKTYQWNGTTWAALYTPSGGGVPQGTIVMWSGLQGAVPAGWAICDGTQKINGIAGPDLRDKFIIASGTSHAVDSSAAASNTGSAATGISQGSSGAGSAHAHGVSAGTGAESSHTHGPGTLADLASGTANKLFSKSTSGVSASSLTGATAGGSTHSHTVGNTDNESSHTHTAGAITDGGHIHSASTPAYYTLAFIQKT